MVKNRKQDNVPMPAKQGVGDGVREPNKINASTTYDFQGRSLTAYGGLLPVTTMLEKLDFLALVAESVTVKRQTKAMSMPQFVLAMVLASYIGFSRLYHLRFLQREPMLTGILGVLRLPPQSTFWRFLRSLHLTVVGQLLTVQTRMRQRVWETANVQLEEATLDTDTTVHTLYGHQMGARIGYNPKNKGKKSFQPMVTFLAETKEYVMGELRNGDRPTGGQIARHLKSAVAALPATVKRVRARADSGFYCWEAVEAYENLGCQFILVARKTARLVEQLKAATWKPSPRTDADGQCEFWYQPEGWSKAYRFLALRYEKVPETARADQPQQYQLFETVEYTYRVFVTNMDGPLDAMVWFYNQRGGAENLIKEANHDAGLAAHPSQIWAMNAIHFQIAMLAYNLNCWLLLFQREGEESTATLRHTTLATARLRFLFLAAKIRRHAGQVGVRYSDHYEEKGLFHRLMERLRAINRGAAGFLPVVTAALRC
jgi:hypothetical protein